MLNSPVGTPVDDLAKLSGPSSAAAFKNWRTGALEAHGAGMADGTVYAERGPYGLPFAGQRNFGGIGPDPGSLPRYGVTTSDGWAYAFPSWELALSFMAAHPKREAV